MQGGHTSKKSFSRSAEAHLEEKKRKVETLGRITPKAK
jgi:hypothetical protein